MFGRSSSVRLFSVAGIRVGADVSWFVVLLLTITVYSGSFRATLQSSSTVAYLTTVVTALALFASIVVHEFGHAIAARRNGVGVTEIDLYLFGGLTQMDREPVTPAEDFTIAAAGPLATVAVILVCAAVELPLLGGHRLREAIELRPDVAVTPVQLALAWIIASNVLLLAFNLLPALPLDGGRIARSAVWRLTGNVHRATLVAGRLGQLLGIALAAWGVDLLLLRGQWFGLYSLLLAWIVFTSAREAMARDQLGERLKGVRVGDVMDPRPLTVDATRTAEQTLRETLGPQGWPWVAVVEDGDRLLGIARREDVEAAVAGGEGWVSTGSLADAGESWRIDGSRPLTDLLGSESLRTLGAAMVVDGGGRLRGVITLEQVSRALTPV